MSIITGYSKGLYSSWFYYAPTRSLFDCGEGCACYLGNKVYAIENIFLSHDHIDHISGLLNFVGVRQLGRGDREKPLTIYYPDRSVNILRFKKLIELTYTNLSFKIVWVPVLENQTLLSEDGKKTESFKIEHSCFCLSLGYRVVVPRKRLKEKFRGKDIKSLLYEGLNKDELNEHYKGIEFAYTLDAYKVDPSDIFRAEIAIVDSTFLKAEDRGKITHMTLAEAFALATEAQVKKVIFAHFSPRYGSNVIVNDVGDECVNHTSQFDYVLPNRLFRY